MAVVAWAGGVLFVASLAYFGYTYAFTLATPASRASVPVPVAVAIDTLLFLAFAAHHSLFARPQLKRWMARSVPRDLLRPVYVWLASALLAAACAAWQPLPGLLYRQTGRAAWPHLFVVALGLALTAAAAWTLDPLELAGIRRAAPPRIGPASAAGAIVTSFPYNLVRHPIYLGWLLMVFGVPSMTWNRLLMAVLSSAYLVVGVRWEERVLARELGEAYEAYRRKVRWRMVPGVY